MKVEINEKYAAVIQKLIASGNYATAEEVVETALDQWAVSDSDYAPGELDALIKPALEQMRRGKGIPHDEAMRRLDEHIAARTEPRKSA